MEQRSPQDRKTEHVVPQTITSRFKQSFSWNFFGSLTYEVIKVALSWLLFTSLTEVAYARLGIILSLIYFTTRLADFGNAYALSPYLLRIQQSRELFKLVIIRNFFLPQVPVLFAALAGLLWYVDCQGLLHGRWLFIILGIVLLETYRLFFRYYLHGSFAHRRVVTIELATYCAFILTLFFWRSRLTLMTILTAHLVESAVATLLLGLLFYRRYQAVPHKATTHAPPTNTIFHGKLFVYMSRIGREFSSNNFLTPVISNLFDAHDISIFYLMGTTVSAISAIIRNTFLYSGNAVLALTKQSTFGQLRTFAILSGKLAQLVLPLYLTLLFQLPLLIRLSTLHWQGAGWLITFILFLVMITVDLWANLYEQYYIVREAGHIFFAMRLLEILLFVALALASCAQSLVPTFSCLVIIKIIGLATVGLYAYRQWGVKPGLDYSPHLLAITTFFNLLVLFLFS